VENIKKKWESFQFLFKSVNFIGGLNADVHDFLLPSQAYLAEYCIFLNSHSGGGVESKLGPLGTSATNWPIVSIPDDCEDGEFCGMKIGRGKYSEKTCLSATLSTTNPNLPEPGSNPDHRGGKPATKRIPYHFEYDTLEFKRRPVFECEFKAKY
jgi:hypothetical protein